MTVRLRSLLWLAPAALVGGLAFAWSGLFNVAASSGHWAITDWFLHFVMTRSVAFRAGGVGEPPPLDDPALIRRGAGHFATGCAICHGDPAAGQGVVVRGMTPPPPPLAPRIALWEPRELFWIVEHGVKFTGMPAWPALTRDDEVWAIVAFLRKLPELSAVEYRRLAFGEVADGSMVAGSTAAPSNAVDCVRCHGLDGLGDPSGAFPRLDIQSEDYLLSALRAYAEGRRPSGIMETALSGRPEDALAGLARFYAKSHPLAPATASAAEVDSGLLERGRQLALHGDAAANIAACSGCHGPGARPEFPRLAGQYAEYLRMQLRLFAAGGRGGGRFVDLMTVAAHALSERDIEAVSVWHASRPPRVLEAGPSPDTIDD